MNADGPLLMTITAFIERLREESATLRARASELHRDADSLTQCAGRLGALLAEHQRVTADVSLTRDERAAIADATRNA